MTYEACEKTIKDFMDAIYPMLDQTYPVQDEIKFKLFLQIANVKKVFDALEAVHKAKKDV